MWNFGFWGWAIVDNSQYSMQLILESWINILNSSQKNLRTGTSATSFDSKDSMEILVEEP